MTATTLNPLAKHFRQPAIYIRLPSQGKYWPPEALDMPLTNSIPVYPMTAKDEIILRTPDALLNGQGVVDVIQSCCPSIKNAWLMPSMDADAVLIGIRIASYGNQMDMDVNCPACDHQHAVAVDLSYVNDRQTVPDYSQPVTCDEDISIQLKPQQYSSVNNTNQIRYEEQRVIDALGDADMPEEQKLETYARHLQRIVDLNLEILINSIDHVQASDGTAVYDPAFIREYLENCSADVVHKLQDALEQITANSGLPKLENSCPECSEPYAIPLEFDYANFFAKRSSP
jgi:hypothetical protein